MQDRAQPTFLYVVCTYVYSRVRHIEILTLARSLAWPINPLSLSDRLSVVTLVILEYDNIFAQVLF